MTHFEVQKVQLTFVEQAIGLIQLHLVTLHDSNCYFRAKLSLKLYWRDYLVYFIIMSALRSSPYIKNCIRMVLSRIDKFLSRLMVILSFKSSLKSPCDDRYQPEWSCNQLESSFNQLNWLLAGLQFLGGIQLVARFNAQSCTIRDAGRFMIDHDIVL